ncbi:MAG: signal recognition particle-docking protein FtsY [Christensenellales bacterium]
MGLFSKIKKGLEKTKNALALKLGELFKRSELDDDFFEELEFILISSDIGVNATNDIIEELKERSKKEKIKECEKAKELLKNILVEKLSIFDEDEEYPLAYLIIGVNGVGKTTSIGKLANYFKSKGKEVVLAAGDTFRAAASDQLNEWATRSKVKIIKHSEGADPASVVYDAVESMKAKKSDVLLIDTAGRLHNKVNLMEELKKISKIVANKYPECNYKKILVLDATTGQNAVSQVQLFNEAVGIDGIILTKLDGTSKGGIIIPIISDLEVPVKFVGVGEGMDDLLEFNAKDFVDGIFEN